MFEGNFVWNISVYSEQCDNPFFPFSFKKISARFWSKKIRTTKSHVHTVADPFLVVKNDILYLFYESQAISENGVIKFRTSTDGRNFSAETILLKELFHLSFPFVFEDQNNMFMIPESCGDSNVSLYQFENFPNQLKKKKELLHGNFVDTACVKIQDVWYLFTTLNGSFQLYYSPNLADVDFKRHPIGEISNDMRFNRNAGAPFYYKDKLYRVSQDCSISYGRNVNLFEITKINLTDYEEKLVQQDCFSLDEEWKSDGVHHISFCDFKGERMIAIDGKGKDFFINKLSSLFFKFLK